MLFKVRIVNQTVLKWHCFKNQSWFPVIPNRFSAKYVSVCVRLSFVSWHNRTKICWQFLIDCNKIQMMQFQVPFVILNRSSRLQMFFKIGFVKNFANFTGKKHVLESLFNKVAALKTCNSIRKRIQHRRSPVKVTKFLKTGPVAASVKNASNLYIVYVFIVLIVFFKQWNLNPINSGL